MNPKLIFFLVGLITGGTAGGVGSALYFKKKYEEEYEDAIDEMEEYYKVADRYRRAFKDEDEEESEINPRKDNKKKKIKNEGAENGRDKGPLSKEDREEIRSKLQRNWEGTTHYASMFDPGGEPDDDEEDSPSIFEESGDEVSIDMDATEEHRKNRNKKPKIISSEAVGELPAYFNNETFFYYSDVDVLTDEENNEISDPETYLGDSLTKYGFNANGESIIYVVNYALDTIFTVQKMNGEPIVS